MKARSRRTRFTRTPSFRFTSVLVTAYTPLGTIVRDSRGVFYIQEGRVEMDGRSVPTGIRRLTPEQVAKARRARKLP